LCKQKSRSFYTENSV